MKTISHIIFLLSLLNLASCGAKKSGMTLTISNSMAISNTAYSGGLVFFGKSSNGKMFSAPVAYNTGSGNQVQIELDRGQWTFAAVGWNGSVVFEGSTTECAKITTTLDSAEQTINLDLTAVGCTDSFFGGNNSGNNFKPLNLVTCGTLYDNTIPGSISVLAADNLDFCTTNVNVAPDFKQYAKSAIVSVPVLVPGQNPTSTSPLSFCEPLTLGKMIGIPKKIPGKNLPIQVELFDSECTDTTKKPIAKYSLLEGMNFTYSAFDHLFFPQSNSNLYLLASLSRRGTSSLMDSLPEFKCHASQPCIKYPTSSTSRYIAPGKPIYIKPAGTDLCSQLDQASDVTITNSSSTTSNISTFNEDADCVISDGKIFVKIQNSYLSAASCSLGTSCSISLTFASGTTTLSFTSEDGPNGVYSLSAYEFILNTIGHEDIISSPFATASVGLNAYNSLMQLKMDETGYEEDDRHFGLLSDIRTMFRPDTLGGLLARFTTANTLTGSNLNFSFWEDGEQKSYNLKVVAESSNAYIPMYMYSDSNASTASENTTRPFTHKMTLSKIVGGDLVPEMIFRFDYGTKVGMSEWKNIEVDKTKNELRTYRDLIFWNTAVLDHARFEKYSYQKIVQNTNQTNILSYATSFTRAERESTASTASEYNTRIDENSFRSDKVGTTFYEQAQKKLAILKDSKAIYSQSSAKFNDASNPLDYFTKDFFYEYNNSAAVSANTAYARSPNNEKMIMAWPEYTGSGWDLKIVRQTVGAGKVINTITIGSDTMIYPKVSINNGGEATVAWIKTISTNNTVYAMTWNGSAWKEATGSTATISSGIIATTGGSIDSYSGALKVDLVDADPTSNGSTKALVYSHNVSSVWYLKMKTYSSGTDTWSSTTSTSIVDQPKDIDIIKADGSDYYITHAYNNTSVESVEVRKITTNLGTTVNTDTASITSSSPILITQLKTDVSPPDLNVYVIDFSDQTKNEFAVYDESATNLATFESLLNANFEFNFNQASYCFNRSTTTGNALGAANLAPSSACVAPDTSFALPIKRSTNSPVFDGYNNDIKGLNPTSFVNIFSM